MAQDSSFDVVSQVDLMEVSNAVQQASKEIAQRFDFKGTSAGITAEGKEAIVLTADDENQLERVYDVLAEKLARRKVSLKSLERSTPEAAAKGTLRQRLKVVSGLEGETAKDIAKFIRGLGLKVQPTIMGDHLRVTGKKKDDLQAVMTALREKEWPRALQFENYR
ncbi:MAG: YajQ family cyclic di-GMP-binding protein [Gemmatimonadetes bacterium]|nr:YajQ family cyclic di-GMP-binding protein [Gemmatimonadota bacterium]